MANFLGIKYHSKLSDNEYLNGKKATEAWDAVTDTANSAWDAVTDTANSAWDAVTDTANSVADTITNAGESVYNAGNNAINTVTKGFGTVTDTLKKYWYVPVILGGVIIGYKILGTANTAKLLRSLATN